jgi:hypothetical protein
MPESADQPIKIIAGWPRLVAERQLAGLRRRGAGAKRMRCRPCRHANPLQGLPIAVLSLFNWLQQIARPFAARISLDAERAGGAREHTEKSHWEPFRTRTNVAQTPAFANNFPVRCGRAADPAPSGRRRRPGAPAQCGHRRGRAPDRRSGPKNRETGFEEQGTFFEEQGTFCVRAGSSRAPCEPRGPPANATFAGVGTHHRPTRSRASEAPLAIALNGKYAGVTVFGRRARDTRDRCRVQSN